VQAAILARTHARASARSLGPSNPLPELADAERFRQRVLAFTLGYGDIVSFGDGRPWRIRATQFVRARPARKPVREFFVCAPVA